MQMKKVKIYEEWAYVLGQFFLAWGAALITSAGFGVSMVIAPAFLISEKVDALTFGTAEYLFQGFLIGVICLIIRRFRPKYLLSFLTAFMYGCLLDLDLYLISLAGTLGFAVRCVIFVLGVVSTSLGVTFFFNTYLPPGVYELFVKCVSERFGFPTGKTKLVYDCSSLALSVAMSFLFFGTLRGIGVGTLICTFANGNVITLFSRLFSRRVEFVRRFSPPAWLD